MPPETAERSFPVHGGRCTVDGAAGTIRVEQTASRHLHVVHVLVTVLLLVLAAYSLATGWRYATPTPGRYLGWPSFLLLAAIGPVFRAVQLTVARANGFTWADRIPLDDVESVRLTTRSMRWYLKTRRTVPTVVVRYRVGGATRKRRIMLAARFEAADVERALDAFAWAGIEVHPEPSAEGLYEDAALQGRDAD